MTEAQTENLTLAFRILSTVLLLIFVYGETGPWTTACLTLLAVNTELSSKILKSKLRSVGVWQK